MYTIDKETTNEIIINKSVFITFLKPINNIDEAKAYLENKRKEYPDATHHVRGYIVGKSGENGHYTDDGEPSGTSGQPIFEVLRKNNLTNIVFDVIRYYGGIKLGAGGLVRAYSKSISEVIKLAKIVPIIEYVYYQVTIDYNYLKLMENLLGDHIIEKRFSQNITLLVKSPKDQFNLYSMQIKNITSNLANIQIIKKD